MIYSSHYTGKPCTVMHAIFWLRCLDTESCVIPAVVNRHQILNSFIYEGLMVSELSPACECVDWSGAEGFLWLCFFFKIGFLRMVGEMAPNTLLEIPIIKNQDGLLRYIWSSSCFWSMMNLMHYESTSLGKFISFYKSICKSVSRSYRARR